MTPPLLRRHRLGLATLTVVAVLLTSDRPALAQTASGLIKGRLVWAGEAIPKPRLLIKKGDPAVKDCAACAVADIPDESLVVDHDSKGIANAFAYVIDPKTGNPEAERALLEKAPFVTLDQKGCRFVPHVVALHKSQTLMVKSRDSVPHNARFGALLNGGANRVIGPKGFFTVDFTEGEKAPIPVVCDIHTWTKAYLMVFDHPFFAVTKPDGSFEIAGVPAGKQRIVVRQESVGYVTRGGEKGVEIEVVPNGVVDLGEVRLVPVPRD
jgi:hypothetical protein